MTTTIDRMNVDTAYRAACARLDARAQQTPTPQPLDMLSAATRMAEAMPEILQTTEILSGWLAEVVTDILGDHDLIDVPPSILDPLWLTMAQVGPRAGAEVQVKIIDAILSLENKGNNGVE